MHSLSAEESVFKIVTYQDVGLGAALGRGGTGFVVWVACEQS